MIYETLHWMCGADNQNIGGMAIAFTSNDGVAVAMEPTNNEVGSHLE